MVAFSVIIGVVVESVHGAKTIGISLSLSLFPPPLSPLLSLGMSKIIELPPLGTKQSGL